MSNEKIAKSPEEQIEILKNKRNLSFDNYDDALSLLNRINYYNLINGYKRPFLDDLESKKRNEDWYRYGTKFEEIVTLYDFDKKISSLFFPILLKIESEIKTMLSNTVSAKVPDAHMHSIYLNKAFFRSGNLSKKDHEDLDKLISRMNCYIYKVNCQPYIKHYRDKYGYVPLWVLVNAITFGDMALYYYYLENKDKSNITRKMEKEYRINPGELYNILQMMRIYRNILAHDEKFYSYKAKNSNGIRYTLNITFQNNSKTIKIKQETSLLTLLLSMKIFLFKGEYEVLINKFIQELEYLRNQINDELAFQFILDEMGFNDGKYDIKNLQELEKCLKF